MLDSKRLDKLRAKMNESALPRILNTMNEADWTGIAKDCNGLVSLKDILTKENLDTNVTKSESYIMLSSAIENESDE